MPTRELLGPLVNKGLPSAPHPVLGTDGDMFCGFLELLLGYSFQQTFYNPGGPLTHCGCLMREEQQLLGAVATEGTQRDRSMAGVPTR